MVSACHRAQSPTPAGTTVWGHVRPWPRGSSGGSTQSSAAGSAWCFSLGLGCVLTFGRWAVIETLNHQVKELWELMSRLHGTRADEQNIDRVFRETLLKQELKPHGGWKEGQLVTVLRGGVDGLPWWRRLETYGFWQQEEGSFSACKAAVIEQAQCPGNRQGGTRTVTAGIRASWVWNRGSARRGKSEW